MCTASEEKVYRSCEVLSLFLSLCHVLGRRYVFILEQEDTKSRGTAGLQAACNKVDRNVGGCNHCYLGVVCYPSII